PIKHDVQPPNEWQYQNKSQPSHEYIRTDVYNPIAASNERIRIAKYACKRLNSSRHRMVAKQFFISQKYHFMFNNIPKVASTTWRELLSYADEDCRKNKPAPPAADINDYTKVVFFREPLVRLVSCYFSKFHISSSFSPIYEKEFRYYILKIRAAGINLLRMPGHPWKRLNVTFSEFVQFVIKYGNRKLRYSKHWKPQYTISDVCSIDYDFIGHFEELAYDGPFALQKLGIANVVEFPIVHSTLGDGIYVDTMLSLSWELIKKVVEFYWQDYEILGYNIPSFEV
ncbi:carbohydrate sulfotransferase 14-like, partial [Saccoglossus kowalevskii]|uniref:Carbohydrate sulfotransferase n=1 Tax=Saccoglossus kowalevskii TaxID=10224 RepID=A0ABM0LWJ0_SACKO